MSLQTVQVVFRGISFTKNGQAEHWLAPCVNPVVEDETGDVVHDNTEPYVSLSTAWRS